MERPKILCYSPYNAWELHGLWEITILHALNLRGAEIKHVLCNGVYSVCDIHWDATNPRNELSCLNCQASVTNLSARMGMPFIGLSKYINADEYIISKEYVKKLKPNNFIEAKFGDWEVGNWVKSSVHSHFRADEIDLTNERVVEVYANYIESGLLAAYGLSRIIKEFNPNILFLFNGRQSSLRVALELAKAKNIVTYLHERGSVYETVQIYKNVPANKDLFREYKNIWNKWKEIPLTHLELKIIVKHLCKMRVGAGQNWRSYITTDRVGGEYIRKSLGINKNDKIWTLFTTSLDEEVSEDQKVSFDSQINWVEETIKISIKNDQKLLIKIHPNTGGKCSTGVNIGELKEFVALEKVYRHYSENIKFIFPDDEINTYDLIDITDLGITYGSTVGLEMACMGKKIVVCRETFYDNLTFVWTLKNKKNYQDLLLLATRIVNQMETKRQSLRFAYYFYFRASSINFPYVKMPDPHNGTLNYKTMNDLKPGKEKNLDRICNIVLNNEEIINEPNISKVDIEKNKKLETEFLQKNLTNILI